MDDSEKSNLLSGLIYNKDKKAVAELLASGVDPNIQPQNGNAALHYNVLFGTAEMIPLLLEAGANLNLLNSASQTPLHLAAQRSDEEMYNLLLAAGTDQSIRDFHGCTAADILAILRAIRATRAGDLEALRQLLADHPQYARQQLHLLVPGGINLQGTLLHQMIADKSAEGVKLLLKAGADVEALHSGNATSLAYACTIKGNKAIVKLLLDAGAKVDPEHGRPLHYAAAENQPAVVKMLLEAGADPNRLDDRGWTALGGAATFARQGHKVFEQLLKRGADPRIPYAYGKTVVRILAEYRDFVAVRMLHRHGCYETEGLPPETILVMLQGEIERDYFERFEVLLEEPAVRQAVVENGTETLSKAMVKKDIRYVRALLATGMSPSLPDQWGLTALHRTTPPEPLWALLLEFGADPTVRNLRGLTPLQSFQVKLLWRATISAKSDEIIRMLTEFPWLKDAIHSVWIEIDGKEVPVTGTMLHLAVRLRAGRLLEYLLENGADPNAHSTRREIVSKTALELARELGDSASAELLVKYGAR